MNMPPYDAKDEEIVLFKNDKRKTEQDPLYGLGKNGRNRVLGLGLGKYVQGRQVLHEDQASAEGRAGEGAGTANQGWIRRRHRRRGRILGHDSSDPKMKACYCN
jgi:hypothetical protein